MAIKNVAVKKESFLARVRRGLPGMHPAERRLGEFVCEFPGELASYSAQELAKLANVSKATVSRFVRRLGYETYEAARRHARAEQQTGSRLFLAMPGPDNPEGWLSANLEQSHLNLDRTFATISQAEIDAAADAILKARKVWAIGFRVGHAFAKYLQWQLIQVKENIVTIPGSGETLGEHLVSLDKDDVVILIGLRRRVVQMDKLLELVTRSKARLLYITDEGVDLLPSADWHFRCQTTAPGPLFNHVAAMAVSHLLAMRVIERAGGSARDRLRGIESLNDELDEL